MNENYVEKNLYFKGSLQPSIEKLPKLHKEYNDFVEKIEKSDFCNSERRYLTELDFVQQLKKLYADKKRPDLAQAFSDKEEIITNKLANEFGIRFKNK